MSDDLPGNLEDSDGSDPNFGINLGTDHKVVVVQGPSQPRNFNIPHLREALQRLHPRVIGPQQVSNPGGGYYEVFTPRRKKRRRRKRIRHFRAGPPYSRYRERDTILVKPRFIGREEVRLDGELLHHDDYYVSPRHIWDGSIKERTWDEIHPGPPYFVGGPFRRIKCVTPWYQVQGHCNVDDGHSIRHTYSGGFVPTSFGDNLDPESDILNFGLEGRVGVDYGDPSSYGAAGWQKFKPKLQDFEGAVALFELKDIPGMIRDLQEDAKHLHHVWKGMGGHSHFFGPKGVADKFLQYQFGWRPFVGDIQSAINTYHNLDKSVSQAQKDNGKWVRRRGTVLREDEVVSSYTDEITGAYVYPALDGHLYRSVFDPSIGKYRIGQTTFTKQVRRRVWFEGSFRYFVPSLDVGNPQNKTNLVQWVNRLRRFGIRISPTVFYKAFPWSWLADWFVNGSAVVDNLSSTIFDSMVSKYAYTMCRKQEFAINDSKIYLLDRDVHCFWYQEIDSKRREEAHPYGLSWSEDPFTAKQIALLASLGLSRG